VTRVRVPEPDRRPPEPHELEVYERYTRRMRMSRRALASRVIRSGIRSGRVLEVGSGAGWLGLEWLERSPGSQLDGIDISEDMIGLAQRNARERGLADRARYVLADAADMPFEDETFDGVFSNGSLHEWKRPEKVFEEIHRVLKPGAWYWARDLRRDVNPLLYLAVRAFTGPKDVRAGFESTVNAAYVRAELESLLRQSPFDEWHIRRWPFSLVVMGRRG